MNEKSNENKENGEKEGNDGWRKNIEKNIGDNRLLRAIYTKITTLLLHIGHLLLLLLLRIITMIITDYYDYYDE